jgi:hypothetical protein
VDYDVSLAAYIDLVSRLHARYAETITVEPGTSFDKIVNTMSNGQRSVHSFIAKKDKTTKSLGNVKVGDIMKAATWKQPAKHARGNIFDDDPAKALSADGFVRYLK